LNTIYRGLFAFNSTEVEVILTKPMTHIDEVKEILNELIEYLYQFGLKL